MGDLSSDIADFIRERIDSVETLHVLLILRESPDRWWTAQELSAELRSSPNAIGRRIVHLHERSLIGREGDAVRYVASPADDVLVGRLAQTYRERRTSVIDCIFSWQPDPLRSFSDAFKLREDKQ